MILLVRRRAITLLVLVALVFSLGMGVFTYLALQTFGALSVPEQKALAERVLLLAIVGTVLVVALLLLVVRDAVNLSAVFKRLAGMHRMSGDQIHSELRGLGLVGEQIGNLYTSINELSARKSTRIAALDSLLKTVMSRSDVNMLIVNAAGKVYWATPAGFRHLDVSSADVVDRPIDGFVHGERFSETSSSLSRRKGAHVIDEGRDSIVVLPVTNDQGLVAYCVYLLGADARDELKGNSHERPGPRDVQSRQPVKNGTAASVAPSSSDEQSNTTADASGRKSKAKDQERGEVSSPIRAFLRRFRSSRR